MRPDERPHEQPGGQDDRVRDVDLSAPIVLERPQQTDRQEQRGERRTARRVWGQLHEQHQGGHDHDRSPDAKQARHHAPHQADEPHEHPRHRMSPRSGLPQPPPPGVSTRSTSPDASDTLTLGASATPFKSVRPGSPSRPPAAPRGACRRRSARMLASIGASASNSRITPSPPGHRPTPPLPRRKAYDFTRKGYSISRTSI